MREAEGLEDDAPPPDAAVDKVDDEAVPLPALGADLAGDFAVMGLEVAPEAGAEDVAEDAEGFGGSLESLPAATAFLDCVSTRGEGGLFDLTTKG